MFEKERSAIYLPGISPEINECGGQQTFSIRTENQIITAQGRKVRRVPKNDRTVRIASEKWFFRP